MRLYMLCHLVRYDKSIIKNLTSRSLFPWLVLTRRLDLLNLVNCFDTKLPVVPRNISRQYILPSLTSVICISISEPNKPPAGRWVSPQYTSPTVNVFGSSHLFPGMVADFITLSLAKKIPARGLSNTTPENTSRGEKLNYMWSSSAGRKVTPNCQSSSARIILVIQ